MTTIDWDTASLGTASDAETATRLGCAPSRVTRERRARGIPSARGHGGRRHGLDVSGQAPTITITLTAADLKGLRALAALWSGAGMGTVTVPGVVRALIRDALVEDQRCREALGQAGVSQAAMSRFMAGKGGWSLASLDKLHASAGTG